jgi:hypothetical protein
MTLGPFFPREFAQGAHDLTSFPILPDAVRKTHGYGLFSCRYGNIYTARQLLQLFHRAYGKFRPREDFWIGEDGSIVDPFRPTVQPGGFLSEQEMGLDRDQHLAAVRRMFENLDLFVFTLGLTECWRARKDGAVFPICPGVSGGSFDASRYEFYNQPVEDVSADLVEFCARLTSANPDAKIVLTVSPVPLVATAQPGEHVLSATTYSKAVLRAAAGAVSARFANVHYFPAYEIITGNYNRGAYYAADLRSIREEGVEHVMQVFMRHAAGGMTIASKATRSEEPSRYLEVSQRLIDVECDEIALDRGSPA